MDTDANTGPSGRRTFRRLGPLALSAVALALAGFFAYPHLLAWYHYRAACAAAQRDDREGEHAHLLACLQTWKNSPEVALQAARAARRLDRLDEAEQLLRQSEGGRGRTLDLKLEWLLLRLARNDPDLQPRAAIELLRQAPEGHPAIAEALPRLSKMCLASYQLEEARAALTLWAEREPNNPQPLLLRGWTVEQLSPNPEAALSDYRRAVLLDPEDDVTRLRLAEALVKNRQAAEALPELKELRRRQPDSPAVLVNLALCREDLGEPGEAVRLLDVMLSPQRLACVVDLGNHLRADQPIPRDIEQAQWYRQALAQSPYSSQGQPLYLLDLYVRALVERAKLAARDGQDERPFLRQAVKIDPFDYAALYQLCLSLEQRGERTEALRLKERLAKIQEDQRGMREAAARAAHSPHDPVSRCTAAEILLRNGQPREALRWLQSALREAPGHPQALHLLAVYRRQTRTPAPSSRAGHEDGADAAAEKKGSSGSR